MFVKFFLVIKKKIIFVMGLCPKNATRGCKLIFMGKILFRGIHLHPKVWESKKVLGIDSLEDFLRKGRKIIMEIFYLAIFVFTSATFTQPTSDQKRIEHIKGQFLNKCLDPCTFIW